MNIVAHFLVALCSIFICIVHFPKFAHAVTKTMAFGRGHPFTVKVWHNGQWLRDFETEQDGNGILYKKLNTRQWTGFEDNALIRFQYENGMLIQEIRVSKLRLKKEIFFQRSRTQYEISVFHNEQRKFEGYAIYDSSKQKNYLAIDPEQWLQLYPNDVITFKCNVRNGQQVLGTATVELLREVGESTYDLDFSQGYRHYFRGVHGVIY